MEFPDKTFDRIIIIAILHHLQKDEVIKVLAEAKRVLKPGGEILILEDAKIENLDNFIVRFVQKFDVGNFMRTPQDYREITSDFFKIIKDWSFRSGGCSYYGLLLKN